MDHRVNLLDKMVQGQVISKEARDDASKYDWNGVCDTFKVQLMESALSVFEEWCYTKNIMPEVRWEHYNGKPVTYIEVVYKNVPVYVYGDGHFVTRGSHRREEVMEVSADEE